jgi:transcriptional regulator with XRE-family HTH domain
MHNHIRAIRKQQGLTLAQLARQCDPETTAQTIGRLETGTRTLSLNWLERIAKALNVDSDMLLARSDEPLASLTAIIDNEGANTPKSTDCLPVFKTETAQMAVQFNVSLGDYRAGDVVYLERLSDMDIASALNCDILLPRPGGRFVFGRMLAMDNDKIQILPLKAGARQIVVSRPEWIGAAKQLFRNL